MFVGLFLDVLLGDFGRTGIDARGATLKHIRSLLG